MDSVTSDIETFKDDVFNLINIHYQNGGTVETSIDISVTTPVNTSISTTSVKTPVNTTSHIKSEITDTEGKVDACFKKLGNNELTLTERNTSVAKSLAESDTEYKIKGGATIDITDNNSIVQIAITANNGSMAAYGTLMSIYNDMLDKKQITGDNLDVSKMKLIYKFIRYNIKNILKYESYKTIVDKVKKSSDSKDEDIKKLRDDLFKEIKTKAIDLGKIKERDTRILDATMTDSTKTFQDPRMIAGIRKLMKELRSVSNDIKAQIWTSTLTIPPKSVFRQFGSNLRLQGMEKQLMLFSKDIESSNVQSNSSYTMLYFSKYVDYIKDVFKTLKNYYDENNQTEKLKNVEVLITTLDKINTKAAGNGKELGELLKDIMKLTYAIGGNIVETDITESSEEAIASKHELDFDSIHSKAEKKATSLNKYQTKFQKLFPQVVDKITQLIPSEWII